MLDFLTIFSAVGLQQELKKAHGEQSLVIREDDASPSNLAQLNFLKRMQRLRHGQMPKCVWQCLWP